MADLDEQTHKRIIELKQEGDEFLQDKEYIEAIASFVEALRLLPKPNYQWEAATQLYAAIGDAYFEKQDYERALPAFRQAVRSPNGLGNPFIHLRLGQLYHELGDQEKARDELIRAYMGDGKRIFEGEDPKYLALIKDLI